MTWLMFKKAAKWLWNTNSKLGMGCLAISLETIAKVADAVEVAEGVGVQVNWINLENLEDPKGAGSPKAHSPCGFNKRADRGHAEADECDGGRA